MKPEAVETGGPSRAESIQVMHGYNWIFTQQFRAVTTDELDRLLPAQDIDPFALLQIMEQPEVLAQDPMRRRIPTSIDDEDLKPGTSGCWSCRLLYVGERLDDRGLFSPGVLL